MGCDIHFHVEVRKNGKWRSADKWKNDDGRWVVDYDSRFYTERNYDLFAILADVRNGSGFAGIETGNGFVPIAPPKGIPKDASPRVKAIVKSWDGDGHSHSYFTVAELLAYDWTQVTKKRGWLSGLEYYEWNRWKRRHGEEPSSYCGAIMGAEIQRISLDEMDKKIKEIEASVEKIAPKDDRQKSLEILAEALKRQVANMFCIAEWEIPYYKATDTFLVEYRSTAPASREACGCPDSFLFR